LKIAFGFVIFRSINKYQINIDIEDRFLNNHYKVVTYRW